MKAEQFADRSPFHEWFSLVERLLESLLEPVLYVRASAAPSSLLEPLQRLCERTGRELQVCETVAITDRLEAGFVLLETEPSWYGVYHQLKSLSNKVRPDPFPTVLVPHLGGHSARRDTYFETGLGITPEDHRHPYRRVRQNELRAELEHPFRNGCLTAVEDFLRDSPPSLRFLSLPGFADLGVLAHESRIGERTFLETLFRHPGDVLWELGLIRTKETTREIPDPEPEISESFSVQDASPQDPSFLDRSSQDLVLKADLHRQAIMLLQLRGLVEDLLDSNRWRWGNRIGDLYLKLRRRPQTETVEPVLRQALAEIKSWKLHEKLLDRKEPKRDLDVEGDFSIDADVSEPGLSSFHRFIQELEPVPIESTSLAADDLAIQSKARVGLKTGPLVSVILPTHNRIAQLRQAVASVREQTYDYWQLVICDDASVDDTEAWVRGVGDERIEYLRIPKSGAAAARNRALEQARGSLISYLDSDNLWHPEFLRMMVHALHDHPSHLAAFSRYLDVEIDGEEHRWRLTPSYDFDYEALIQANRIDLNTFVHRRELYDLLGGFDESLERQQDWDLLLKYGYVADALLVPHCLAVYRRNRAWDQITYLQDGEMPRRRIRKKVGEYYAKGGPPRRPVSSPNVLLVEVEGSEARRSRVAGLTEALESRVLTRVSLTEARENGLVGEAVERGDTVYVLGPVSSRIAEELCEISGPGLLFHDQELSERDEATWKSCGRVHRIVPALMPDNVPAEAFHMPPSIPTTSTGSEPETQSREIDRMTVEICPIRSSEPELRKELEERLRQAGYRLREPDEEALDATPTGAVIVPPTREPCLGEVALACLVRSFRCKIPVIALPLGALHHPVRLGVVFGVYEPGASGFVQSLDRLRLQPKARRELTEKARRWNRRRFSPRAVELSFTLLEKRLRGEADQGTER